MSIQIPINNPQLEAIAAKNNILFNRLSTASDVGRLPYTCDDIKLRVNELINSRNINYAFEKIYTNLTYITSRCFTHNSNIPKSYLGLQYLTDNSRTDEPGASRFSVANDMAMIEASNVDDVIGFISSTSSIGILSGGYTRFVCVNYNGGCFELNDSDQNKDIDRQGSPIRVLAEDHGLPVLLTNTSDSTFYLPETEDGKYVGQALDDVLPLNDICDACGSESLFSALILVPDRSFSRVMQNTEDYIFSNITSISIDKTNSILFVLDEGLNTIFIYDTSGYIYGDDIFLRRDPQGRMYLGQIGGKDSLAIERPKDIFVDGTRLYVFESGDSESAPRIKVFSTTSQSLLNTFSMYSLLPDLGSDISNVNYAVNAGIVSGNTIFSIISNGSDNRMVQTNIITGENIVTRLSFLQNESEVPKQLRLGVNNSDSCYILTDKNIYKVHLTKLNLEIGRFDLTIISDDNTLVKRIRDGDYTIGSMYVRARTDYSDEDEILVTFEGADDLYRFADSNNFINVIRPEFVDYLYNLDSVVISKEEHVNALTYNHAFNKIFDDHVSFINNLRGRFIADEASTRLDSGFRYVTTQSTVVRSGLLKDIEKIRANINVGVNEFVLTAVINRCLTQICKLQEIIMKLVEFTDEKNTCVRIGPGKTQKLNCDDPGKGRTIIDKPPDRKCIEYSIYTLVTPSQQFSVKLTSEDILTQDNYTNTTLVKEMLAKAILHAPFKDRRDILEDVTGVYFAGYDDAEFNTIRLSKILYADPIFTKYKYTVNEDSTITHTFGLGPIFSDEGISVNQQTLDQVNSKITDHIISRIIILNKDSLTPVNDPLTSEEALPLIQDPSSPLNKYTSTCFSIYTLDPEPYDPPQSSCVEVEFWIQCVSQDNINRDYIGEDGPTGTDILFILDLSGSVGLVEQPEDYRGPREKDYSSPNSRLSRMKRYISSLVRSLYEIAVSREDLDDMFRVKIIKFANNAGLHELDNSIDWVTLDNGINIDNVMSSISGLAPDQWGWGIESDDYIPVVVSDGDTGDTLWSTPLDLIIAGEDKIIDRENTDKRRRAILFLSDGKIPDDNMAVAERAISTVIDTYTDTTLYPILFGSEFSPFDSAGSVTDASGDYASIDTGTRNILELGRIGQGLGPDQKSEVDFIFTELSDVSSRNNMTLTDAFEKAKQWVAPKPGKIRYKIKQKNEENYTVKLPYVGYENGVRSLNSDLFKFNTRDIEGNLLTDDNIIRNVLTSTWNISQSDNLYMAPGVDYDIYFTPIPGCSDEYTNMQITFEVNVDLMYMEFGTGKKDTDWIPIDTSIDSCTEISTYSKDYGDHAFRPGTGSEVSCKSGPAIILNSCKDTPSPTAQDPSYDDEYKIIPDNIELPPNSGLYRVNKLVNGEIEQKTSPGSDTFTDDGTHHYVSANRPYGDYVILTWQDQLCDGVSGATYVTVDVVDKKNKQLLFPADGKYIPFKGFREYSHSIIDTSSSTFAYKTTYASYFVQSMDCNLPLYNSNIVRVGKNVISGYDGVSCKATKIYLGSYISEPVSMATEDHLIRGQVNNIDLNLFNEVWVHIKGTCR